MRPVGYPVLWRCEGGGACLIGETCCPNGFCAPAGVACPPRANAASESHRLRDRQRAWPEGSVEKK